MKLTLIDIVTVGIPEVVLSLMICIYLFGRSEENSKPSSRY